MIIIFVYIRMCVWCLYKVAWYILVVMLRISLVYTINLLIRTRECETNWYEHACCKCRLVYMLFR